MAVVLIIAAVFAAGYWVSLRIWPETYCRRCEGGGKNAGSNRVRFGRCRKCGGTGSKPRLGTRLLRR